MTNHGDDCYFYYYSTCSKGDDCPFRHCEAAMGNETVCNLWQEGRCFRAVCKFRHMEITKKRKEIPCYWENHPSGCQKPHCAFFHEKPRYIDGVFVPCDKGLSKNEEPQQEEPVPSPAPPLPTATNPQLRGVIKTESQEPVPSPTHPPVVINPADDDEDEDDQFSEEGDDGKVGPSPRKLPKSDDSLNFGVSTLEEIRLRKALKASMRRAEFPVQVADTSANGEKENIQSHFRPALYTDRDAPLFEESRTSRGSVADRLGRKIPNIMVNSGEGPPLKRSLAERLGRVVAEESSLEPPQKALKPVKERLRLPAAPVITTQAAAEISTNSKKTPGQIRIKTLEEIRQEKAAKSQSQSRQDESSLVAPEICIGKTIPTKSTKGAKRAISVKDISIGHIKTFSEILHAKKKKQEVQQLQISDPKTATQSAQKGSSQSQEDPDHAGPNLEAIKAGEVRVKTLEEIRREKASRIEALQLIDTQNKKSPDFKENGAKKRGLLRIKKPSSESNITTEKTTEVTEKSQDANSAAPETSPATSNSIKVKTFEEIMREKRLRKQVSTSDPASASAETEPSQELPTSATLKREINTKVSHIPSDSSSPVQNTLVRKLIPLKSKAASPVNNTAAPGSSAAVIALTSVPVKRRSSPQSLSRSMEAPVKNPKSPTAPSPAKQARMAPRCPPAQSHTADKALNNNQKKSPEHSADARVRPKLNVKPSVMKPAGQVTPGQKRRGAERSAIAAVKPLNTASAVMEDALQDVPHTGSPAFPSSSAEAQPVPLSPAASLESSSSPLREEPQAGLRHGPGQESKMAAREVCTVTQSPALKSPTRSSARRKSVAASRTTSTSSAAAASSASAVDDFEDLINEFTDDRLEDEVDPDIAEDDLLQELSDMIDS